MTHPPDGYRGLVIAGLGALLLSLGALQLWRGKAFQGYGWKNMPAWVAKSSRPGLFWANVALAFVLGAGCLLLGVRALLSAG